MQSKKSKTKLKSESKRLEFEAIGTHWIIELFTKKTTEDLEQQIHDRIEDFDKNYSRFRADSLVTAMSRKAGIYTLPDNAKPMMDLYQDLYRLTHGKMTPLVGQLVSDAGYDAEYSLTPKATQTPPRWEDALEYDFPYMTLKQPALLDFGACGKGYLVDIVSSLIKNHGIGSFCVNAGGDMLIGNTPLKVGLEHPDNNNLAIGIATLQNNALCGSAGNRRKWVEYTHIFDPETKSSPTHISSVWVCAKQTMLADGLTTALNFALPSDLKKHYTFSYAIMHDDGSLTSSADFPGEFFKG